MYIINTLEEYWLRVWSTGRESRTVLGVTCEGQPDKSYSQFQLLTFR